jgi:hypothetical protein
MFHELLVAWPDFFVGEASWEPYSVMAVDVPDMVAKFMESREDIYALRSDIFEVFHREVVCAAKDETSVDIMCRSCVVISCGKSIITNLAGEAIDARCGDCV